MLPCGLKSFVELIGISVGSSIVSTSSLELFSSKSVSSQFGSVAVNFFVKKLCTTIGVGLSLNKRDDACNCPYLSRIVSSVIVCL